MLIGGDDSVVWSHTHTAVNEARPLPIVRAPNRALHTLDDGRYRTKDVLNVRSEEGYVEGRDPVATDGKYFKIIIRVPEGQAGLDFLEDLRTAAATTPAGGKLQVNLPILARTYDQIDVNWPFDKGTSSAV
jgi:hypothetical protein